MRHLRSHARGEGLCVAAKPGRRDELLRVVDLHGNLHEWISDPDGTFKGGFYADASINGSGCSYTTTAHSMSYHDYSTGFRCCSSM